MDLVRLCPKPHSHSGEKQEKRKFTDVFGSALIVLLILWSWVRVPAASLENEGFDKTTTSCTHSVPISRVQRGAEADALLSQFLLSAWHLVASHGLPHPQIPSLEAVPFQGGRSRERRLRFRVHSVSVGDIEEETRGRERLIGHHQIATFIGSMLARE